MATRSGGAGKGGGKGVGTGGGRGGAGDDAGPAPRKGLGGAPGRAVAAGRGTTTATRNRARGGAALPAGQRAPKSAAKTAAKSALQAAAATAAEAARATAGSALSTVQGAAKATAGDKLPAVAAKAAPAGRAARAAKPEVGARPAPQETGGRVMALGLRRGALSPEMEAYFAKCEEKLGYVPNVLLAYAHDTAKLEAFAQMYNDLMLAPSGLSKLEREMIAVAVSSVNRCYYCLTAHGAAVRQLSGDPVLGEMLVMNYRAADLAPRHRAMLDFAVQLTEAPDTVEDVDREMLREAGFSDRDVWDIAAVTSFFNMSNRMAAAVDMRPNRSYHGEARTLP
jgi:uncharacterized peroxidase-related enzyme